MRANRASLAADLSRIGVAPGGVVMVHAGLRSVGPVVGGAATVVHALLDAVGDQGTIVAYVDFEPFYDPAVDVGIPVFDKRTARAALDHGVLHETLRTWPGALRSDHPDAGVVAVGVRADWIVRDHPLQYGYGEGSPFARIVDAGGDVLLLGAPLETMTLLHLAEHRAHIPDKRIVRYDRLMPTAAGPAWVSFEEFDTTQPVHPALPEDCFTQIGEACLAAGGGTRGSFGAATAVRFGARGLVEFAVQWVERAVRTAP
ncbi:MAG: aminoglycoside 3-N-acetyltransferase [Vicinamibacterales bacterium]